MNRYRDTLTSSASLAGVVKWSSSSDAIAAMGKSSKRKPRGKVNFYGGDVVVGSDYPIKSLSGLEAAVLAYHLSTGGLKLAAESYRVLKRISARWGLFCDGSVSIRHMESRRKMSPSAFAMFVSKYCGDVVVVDAKTGVKTAYAAGDIWRQIYEHPARRVILSEDGES